MGLEAEQHGSPQDAIAGGFKRHGQFRSRPTVTSKDVVEVGGGCPSSAGDFINGLPGGEKAFFEAHTTKCNSRMLPSQVAYSPCMSLYLAQNPAMKWPQLDKFKARLSEYQRASGKTQAQVAAELDTTYGTLRFWLSGTRSPSLPTLQRASALFGCSVTEFVDDPGAPPAGATVESSEIDRFMLRIIGEDLTKLTDREKQAAFEAWRSILRGYEKS